MQGWRMVTPGGDMDALMPATPADIRYCLHQLICMMHKNLVRTIHWTTLEERDTGSTPAISGFS